MPTVPSTRIVHSIPLFVAALLAAVPVGAQEVRRADGSGAGEVLAAIENARQAAPALRATAGRSATSVEIVDVGAVVPEAERGALLRALERRARDVEALRDAIDYSPDALVERPGGRDVRLEDALTERGVAIEDVVGVEVASETVTVYVWDRTAIADEAAEL